MGKVAHTYIDKIIPEIADRNANRLRVYRAPNGEITIHFRNLKIVLHNDMEISEWVDGFKEALEELQRKDYFKNDL